MESEPDANDDGANNDASSKASSHEAPPTVLDDDAPSFKKSMGWIVATAALLIVAIGLLVLGVGLLANPEVFAAYIKMSIASDADINMAAAWCLVGVVGCLLLAYYCFKNARVAYGDRQDDDKRVDSDADDDTDCIARLKSYVTCTWVFGCCQSRGEDGVGLLDGNQPRSDALGSKKSSRRSSTGSNAP